MYSIWRCLSRFESPSLRVSKSASSRVHESACETACSATRRHMRYGGGSHGLLQSCSLEGLSQVLAGENKLHDMQKDSRAKPRKHEEVQIPVGLPGIGAVTISVCAAPRHRMRVRAGKRRSRAKRSALRNGCSPSASKQKMSEYPPQPRHQMDRRTFIIKAGQAFPVVAGAVYVIGCDSDSTDDGNGNGNGSTTIVAISTVDAGHSHRVEFPEGDLSSSSAKTYQSSSSGGHTHSVVLSEAQLNTIEGGGSVTVTSSNSDGHTHQFTFTRSN